MESVDQRKRREERGLPNEGRARRAGCRKGEEGGKQKGEKAKLVNRGTPARSRVLWRSSGKGKW